MTAARDPDQIRASDADRDAVAARLREALAEGRLDPDEHSERLDAVYSARTMGELVPLTRDLPESDDAARAARSPAVRPEGFVSPRPVYGADRVTGGPPSGRIAAAIMGGADRSGDWTVPARYFAFTAMGGVTLDLREARFTQRETTIWIGAVMGGVGVLVPDDIQVRVHGLGIMGGFGMAEQGEPPSVTDPGAPVVHIRGFALMGGGGATRKRRRHQRKGQEKRRPEIEEDDD